MTAAPLVQAIHGTARVAAWAAIVRAAGFQHVGAPSDDWTELVADGSLAFHGASAHMPVGRTDLHVLVDDLSSTADAIDAAGWSVSHEHLDGVGGLLRVLTARDDLRVTVGQRARSIHAGSDIAVQPIWYTPAPDRVRTLLEALGLRPTLGADSGSWLELAADGGGGVGVHASTSEGMQLGLATRDVDVTAARLEAAGASASIVDEAYNRTIRVDDPDGGQLWINGPIDDLHGYHRLDG